MRKFIMDLQLFSDFDFDAFEREFEESFEDGEEEEEEDQGSEEEEGQGSEGEEDSEEEEEVKTDDAEKPPVQTAEANRAFADLRRQAQEGERFKAFVQRIADESGMTSDQVIEAYEQKQLETQAKEQKVPVEMLQRIQKLEATNHNAEQELRKERFNSQVNQTQAKYKLSDTEIRETVQKAIETGIDVINIPFENVYKLVNHDSIVAKELELARQKDLEAKKKRQEQAAPPNSSGGSADNVDSVADDVEAFLKEMGDL